VVLADASSSTPIIKFTPLARGDDVGGGVVREHTGSVCGEHTKVPGPESRRSPRPASGGAQELNENASDGAEVQRSKHRRLARNAEKRERAETRMGDAQVHWAAA